LRLLRQELRAVLGEPDHKKRAGHEARPYRCLGGNAQKGQGRHGIHGLVYLASAKFSTFFALRNFDSG